MWDRVLVVLGCVAYVVLRGESVVMCGRCDDVVHSEIYGGLEGGCREQDGGGDVVLVVYHVVIVVVCVMVMIVVVPLLVWLLWW